MRNKRKNGNVLPGERDENGKLKTPHTEYGVFRNIVYVMKALWEYKPIVILYICIGSVTMPCMQYIWSFFTKYIIDVVQLQSVTGNRDLTPLIKAVITIVIVDLVLRAANTLITNRNWPGFVEARLRLMERRIEKTLTMNYETLEQPHILDMVSKADSATGGNNQGVEGLMHNVEDMARIVVTMGVSFSMITILDWRLILALIVICIVNFISFRRAMIFDKKHVWDELPHYWRQQNYMTRCTQDFDFAKDIRLFGMKNMLHERQHESLQVAHEKYIKGRKVWLQHSVVCTLTGIVQGALMYLILIKAVLDPTDSLTIGEFTLYISLCGAFSSALGNFLNSLSGIERNSMQVDDFRTFLDFDDCSHGGYRLIRTENAIIMEAENNADKGEEYKQAKALFEKGILNFECRNVCYKYDGAENYALKNLNIKFDWGERLAVVGLNGAGKTTFVKLLLRLYKVTEGEILLNGINVQRYNRDDYFSLFAPVFQNVEVFGFLLSENVSMKPEAETDKKLACDSLIRGGLKEKLAALPKGVDTGVLKIIHEDGIDFSGGEKQKLALARALYKDSPIIVMDEPTAALDALAEYELYKHFDSIIGSKSALYISHRLSSTRFCDNVAMFSNGELVEYGTHEKLMKKGGEYAKMFEVQAQYYEDDANNGKEVAVGV
ncbi:MAG: ABC transporter ATP-binding protein/permease [Lachnospiraceae bacterium]|nr:ABC transporter ATP-binding protein/permease [Lachnospiraceae bacterium]